MPKALKKDQKPKKSKRSKKRLALVVLLVVILILAVFFIFKSNIKSKDVNSGSQQPSISGKVIEEVHLDYLEKKEIFLDLPENSKVNLKTYNFDSGERTWEKAYKISKGKIVEGSYSSKDVDLLVIIHSKYLNTENAENADFCTIVSQAKKNGDLGIETSESKLSLLSKYGGFSFKYKDCLGL